jgi:Methylamine utilisation protein MauE
VKRGGTRDTGIGKRESGTRIVLRVLIGTILVATAIGKLLDVAGFARVLGNYRVFPEELIPALAAFVPIAELVLGVWLFGGRRPFAAAVTALAVHLAYAAWSAVAILRGLKLANCGCFGVFWPRPLGWSTVVEDLAVAAACGVLVAWTPRDRAA